jgi:hypothetical protein
MIMRSHNTRKSFAFKALSFVQAAIFIFSTFATPLNSYAQSIMDLPAPGALVSPSMDYVPVMLRAVKIDPDQPLVFDFIVDSGNTQADQFLIKSETEKLVKYFLASLTIPEQDLWVNLSPYERERIVPEAFGRTEMGRDLLAQDYILKQLTASLVDPERDLGKEFWSRVYAKAQEVLGSSELPVDTFNKVWIMPDKAEVYEMNNTAIVGQSSLKILMEEDYLAMQKNMGIERGITAEADEARKISNDIMREIILPEIEKEVNGGKNFALLRQVYQALVLATWYKNNLKESLLAQVYADQNKTLGVSVDAADKEVIYQRYIAAYKQGVFNYIKEDVDPLTNEIVPRKYFSGGVNWKDMAQRVKNETRKVDFAEQIPEKAQEQQGNFSQAKVVMTQSNMKYQESLRPAVTVTGSDFQEQVKAREQGQSGFHLNVDRARTYTPATEKAVLNWSALPEDKKRTLTEKQDAMFKDGEIGEIVMAGGEATRFGGPKTFVKVSDALGDFLQVKVDNLKWIWEKYGTRVPLYILSSETRIQGFQDQLQERDYYGARPEDFHGYVQGTVDTFIPTDAELEAKFKGEQLAAHKKYARAARQANPDGIYRFNGERRPVPAGHLDAIASFIISGQLSDALARGIKVMTVTNIDNLQAILKNDGMIAAFAESDDDFGFILAEKNISHQIKEAGTSKVLEPKVLVRYRENVISFDGINEFEGEAVKEGLKYVINQEKKEIDVFDSQGKKIKTEVTLEPEVGGTLVQYTDENGQVVEGLQEGFALPLDFDHVKAPLFNTNTAFVKPEGLLKLLKVTRQELEAMSFEERSELVRNQLVKQTKANFEFKNHEVDGKFPELGVVDVEANKTKIPVVQLTRIMLQVGELKGAKVGYIVAPRKEVFAPVKEPQDREIMARNNEEALKPYLNKKAFVRGEENDLPRILVAEAQGFSFKKSEPYANRLAAGAGGMKFLGSEGEEISETEEAFVLPGEYTVETNGKDFRVKGPSINRDNWIPDAEFGPVETSQQMDRIFYPGGPMILGNLKNADISGGSMKGDAILIIDGNVKARGINIDNHMLNLEAKQGATLTVDGFAVKRPAAPVGMTPEQKVAAFQTGVIKMDNQNVPAIIVTQGDVALSVASGEDFDIQGPVVVENFSREPINLGQVLRSQAPSLQGTGVSISDVKSADGKMVSQITIPKNVKITVGEDSVVRVTDAAALNKQEQKRFSKPVLPNRSEALKGGIDFNPAALNLKVQRTGKGIQVQFDPAEIQRIKTEGVSGFTPVIINITPVKSMLPALGLVSTETATAT